MARKKWDTAKKVKEVAKPQMHPYTIYKLSKPYKHGSRVINHFAIANITIGGSNLTSIWPVDENGDIIGYLPLKPTEHTTAKVLFKYFGYKLI